MATLSENAQIPAADKQLVIIMIFWVKIFLDINLEMRTFNTVREYNQNGG